MASLGKLGGEDNPIELGKGPLIMADLDDARDRYASTRDWLRKEKAKGYVHGLLVRRDVVLKNKNATRGCVASAMWEDGWRLYLFTEKEDRESFQRDLRAEDRRPDPLEEKAIKDAS